MTEFDKIINVKVVGLDVLFPTPPERLNSDKYNSRYDLFTKR